MLNKIKGYSLIPAELQAKFDELYQRHLAAMGEDMRAKYEGKVNRIKYKQGVVEVHYLGTFWQYDLRSNVWY